VLERDYQAKLIRTLRNMFKDCFILKNDSAYLQGIPDLLILYKTKWAMLEVKSSPNFHIQPNQHFYIQLLDEMSFAAFIYPEIEEDVLSDLQHTFQSRRPSRVSKSKQISLDEL
jgi:hypothetical protein